MAEHPIQGLMQTAMENIKEMVDVNTIVGDPVSTPDGGVILPISKVGFGFAAGGSEFKVDSHQHEEIAGRYESQSAKVALPFGGGSGGGVSITPIAFLVVNNQGVNVVPLDNQTHIYERIIDGVPQMIETMQNRFKGNKAAGMMPGMGMTPGMSMTPGMGMTPDMSGMTKNAGMVPGMAQSTSQAQPQPTGAQASPSPAGATGSKAGGTTVINKPEEQNIKI